MAFVTTTSTESTPPTPQPNGGRGNHLCFGPAQIASAAPVARQRRLDMLRTYQSRTPTRLRQEE